MAGREREKGRGEGVDAILHLGVVKKPSFLLVNLNLNY